MNFESVIDNPAHVSHSQQEYLIGARTMGEYASRIDSICEGVGDAYNRLNFIYWNFYRASDDPFWSAVPTESANRMNNVLKGRWHSRYRRRLSKCSASMKRLAAGMEGGEKAHRGTQWIQ